MLVNDVVANIVMYKVMNFGKYSQKYRLWLEGRFILKIAIQTIVDYNNYGNRLQNFALQKVLENKGHTVLTLRNDFKNPYYVATKSESKLRKIIQSIKSGELIDKVQAKMLQRRKDELVKKYQVSRYEAFRKFSLKYIKESEEIYTADLVKSKELENMDCFVIGSDQVWNYDFPRFSEFDFLPMVHQPKISYAASFGVDSISADLKEFYGKNLSNIDYIAVREEKGKEIIGELLPQKNVKVVLDPTLLLNKEEWEVLIKNKPLYQEKFILTYFLSEPSASTVKYISKIAKSNNLKIKKLANVFDSDLWQADPAEFVNLFSQSEMVFTDSFHACVFSIIFEKYFEVFERNTKRKTMNSRIETLIANLHTGNRWHHQNKELLEMPDYKVINKYLTQEKEKSFEFLESALIECQKKIKVEADA